MAIEHFEQSSVIGVSHRIGDDFLIFGFLGQFLSLLIVQILQAVLEIAQKHIGLVQAGNNWRG